MHHDERDAYLQSLRWSECLLSALLVLSIAGMLVLGCVMAALCWDADSYPAQPHWRDDFAATGNSAPPSNQTR